MHAFLVTAELTPIGLQDVVDETIQRMGELHEGWKQLAAQPKKKHVCSCCSVQ